MSAWMCCDAHFDALLTYALVQGGVTFSHPATNHTAIDADTVEAIGEILKRENARSITTRYGDPDEEGPYTFQPFPHLLSDVEAWKAVQCLDYQSCETDDWSTTAARTILEAIENRISTNTRGRDPRADKAAWEAAPWGIDDETFSAAAVARRTARGF